MNFNITQLPIPNYQAIERFANFSPDLVILDVQMPKRDGFEVCREIRRQPQYTPIVMISGIKKELVDQVVGLEVGADRYILKPFELPLLAAEVRVLLRMAREIHITKGSPEARAHICNA